MGKRAKRKPPSSKDVRLREIENGVITRSGPRSLMLRLETTDGETVVSLGSDRSHMALRISGEALQEAANLAAAE